MQFYKIDDVAKYPIVIDEQLGGDLAQDLVLAINRSCRYGAKKWWKAKGFERQRKQFYLNFSLATRSVTPMAYMAKVFAYASELKAFEEEKTKITRQSINEKACKIIRSLALKHIANQKDGWGQKSVYLSAVIECVDASWLMWERINSVTQKLIINMLEFEANNLLNQKPLYQYDFNGNDMFYGTSQAEVNLDRAQLLKLASCILPSHKHIALWNEKFKEFISAGYAYEKQCAQGYNILEDGIVMYKGAVSPVNMSGIIGKLKIAEYDCMSNQKIDAQILTTAKQIYTTLHQVAMSKTERGGEFICETDKKGRPTVKINYPQGKKGVRARQAIFYATDIYALCFNCDSDCAIKAGEWAKTRMKRILKKQSKEGKYYKNTISSSEEQIASAMANAYLTLVLYALGKINLKK